MIQSMGDSSSMKAAYLSIRYVSIRKPLEHRSRGLAWRKGRFGLTLHRSGSPKPYADTSTGNRGPEGSGWDF